MKHLGESFYDFVPLNAIISGYGESAEDIKDSLLDLFPLYCLDLLIPGKLCAWLFRSPLKFYTKHLR